MRPGPPTPTRSGVLLREDWPATRGAARPCAYLAQLGTEHGYLVIVGKRKGAG
jgi:hypothetical protein